MKKVRVLLPALLLSAVGVLANAHAVSAATCTWTGATNNNFNTAGNWSSCGGGVPQNGDSVTFDVTSLSASATLNNDISNLSLAGITFTGTNSSSHAYTIDGNALTLTGGIITNASATLLVDVTLGANQTWSGSEFLSMGIFDDPKTLGLSTYNLTTKNLSLSGSLTGSGNLSIAADGSTSISGASPSWTGATSIADGGSLAITKANSLGSGDVSVASGGTLSLCGLKGATLANDLSIGGSGAGFGALSVVAGCFGGGGGGGSNADANVKLSGAVTLTSNTTVYSAGTTTLTGPLSGNYTIGVKSGSPGKLVINSSNNTSKTPNGTVVAAKETVTINKGDNQPDTFVSVLFNQTYIINGVRGDTNVEVGGTLKGTGTVGATGVFGTIAPGLSPGCLSTGNLTFYEDSAYEFEIGGTTACTGYDQLKVEGSVLFNGGNISVLLVDGFAPATGQTYVIISNDGSDEVSGTFEGLAEGATFTADGYVYRISYVGGDGNDVTLTVLNVPASPDTGFAQIANNPAIGAAGLLAAGIVAILLSRSLRTKTARRR